MTDVGGTNEEEVNYYQDYRNKPVLVIGFGLSGIIQCHTLLAQGFQNVTVVESSNSFGGVWHVDKQWPGLQAQNTKDNFQFPDMRPKNPNNWDDFPTQEQINQYLKDYIETFDLEKHVHYNCQVKNLSRYYDSNERQWKFKTLFTKSINGNVEHMYDFVICATGYTSNPKFPTCLDQDVQGGGNCIPTNVKVIHSCDIRKELKNDPSFGKDKRVAIVGSFKSAMDSAVWAVEAGGAKDVHVFMVKAPFTVNQYQDTSGNKEKGLVEFNRIFSRLLSWLLPCNPETVKVNGTISKILYLMHCTTIGIAIVNFLWSTKLKECAKLEGTPQELIPVDRKFRDNAGFLCVLPARFADHVNAGNIKLHVGVKCTGFAAADKNKLTFQHVEGTLPQGGATKNLQKSLSYECDVVISATGYKSSLDVFLSKEIQEHLYDQTTGQARLYRAVYCPNLPQMAFVGLHITFNTMFASAAAARWVAELAKGIPSSRLTLPLDSKVVGSTIDAGLAFERSQYKNAFERKPLGIYTTGASYITYLDSVLGDIGVTKLWRSPNGLLDNICGQVKPEHYVGLTTSEKFA